MPLEIKIYVYYRDVRGSSGKATGPATWFDHPYHTETILHDSSGRTEHNKKLEFIGNKVLEGSLSTEDQTAIARLEPYVESGKISLKIYDLRSIFLRLKARLKYRTADTPLIVIGPRIFRGVPPPEELNKAIQLALTAQ
ncbi:MAG: hypothetical protein ACFFB3_09775 [Candidatus Hodarchaeota archaeon]